MEVIEIAPSEQTVPELRCSCSPGKSGKWNAIINHQQLTVIKTENADDGIVALLSDPNKKQTISWKICEDIKSHG
jgi:hypothetical protein